MNFILMFAWPTAVLAAAIWAMRSFSQALRPPLLVVACAGIAACIGLAGARSFYDRWDEGYWLSDVRSGDVLAVPDLDPAVRARIAGADFPPTMATAAEMTAQGCQGVWVQGTHYALHLLDGTPFRLVIIGRATAPDYRYLLMAVGHPGNGCVETFLIAGADLAHLKASLKRVAIYMHEGRAGAPLNTEIGSVRPLTGASSDSMAEYVLGIGSLAVMLAFLAQLVFRTKVTKPPRS